MAARRKATTDDFEPWAGMPVFLVPLDKLIAYARNSKLHPEEQVSGIAASLHEFGWVRPILINSRKDLGIRAGHGTVRGAAKLWESGKEIRSAFDGSQIPNRMVPCVAAEALTTTQIQAYVIADNKLAERATWDKDMLAVEMKELRDADFSLSLMGFELAELEELLIEPLPTDFPTLPSGARDPFQQMTFHLHDEQAARVLTALAKAKEAGDFTGPNTNSNGNALARLADAYLMSDGKGGKRGAAK